MAFNISSLRESLARVARNQYFLIEIPAMFKNSDILTALARATSIPAMTHTTLEIPIRGVNTKILSTPVYNDWAVTFICDEDHMLRNVFLLWLAVAYDTDGLKFQNAPYKQDGIKVSQVSSNSLATKATVVFDGMFPVNIGEVAYDQAGGSFCTFDVTFAYDSYKVMQLPSTTMIEGATDDAGKKKSNFNILG